jgi:toxin YoeB
MSRRIVFVPDAWDMYLYWHGQDRKTLKRINLLIEAASRDPLQALVSLNRWWGI